MTPLNHMNKMKNIKYHTVKLCKVRKSYPLPQTAYIQDRTLSCLGTDTSMKGGGVELVLIVLPY